MQLRGLKIPKEYVEASNSAGQFEQKAVSVQADSMERLQIQMLKDEIYMDINQEQFKYYDLNQKMNGGSENYTIGFK